jgi:hypothetical protein
MLDIWPPFPIVIQEYDLPILDMNNIVAALEHNDRICEICLLGLTSRQMEKVLAAMRF